MTASFAPLPCGLAEPEGVACLDFCPTRLWWQCLPVNNMGVSSFASFSFWWVICLQAPLKEPLSLQRLEPVFKAMLYFNKLKLFRMLVNQSSSQSSLYYYISVDRETWFRVEMLEGNLRKFHPHRGLGLVYRLRGNLWMPGLHLPGFLPVPF